MHQLTESINFGGSWSLAMDADLMPTHSSSEGKLQCGGPFRTLETQTMTHCLAQPDMAAI